MITWVVTSTAKAYEILSLLTTFNCEKLSTQPHIFSEAAEWEPTLLGSKGVFFKSTVPKVFTAVKWLLQGQEIRTHYLG